MSTAHIDTTSEEYNSLRSRFHLPHTDYATQNIIVKATINTEYTLWAALLVPLPLLTSQSHCAYSAVELSTMLWLTIW